MASTWPGSCGTDTGLSYLATLEVGSREPASECALLGRGSRCGTVHSLGWGSAIYTVVVRITI